MSAEEELAIEKRLEEIAKLLSGEFNDRKLYDSQHEEEHRYIRSQMEIQEAKAEFWKGVASKLVTASLGAALIWMGSAILMGIKSYLIK